MFFNGEFQRMKFLLELALRYKKKPAETSPVLF